MASFDVYSKRRKKERGEVPDVYMYDDFTNPFRAQIVYILNDLLGGASAYHGAYRGVSKAYSVIVQILKREYGLFKLAEIKYLKSDNELEELHTFILKERDVERCLDAIELSLRFADKNCRSQSYMGIRRYNEHVNVLIDEVNHRFKEHGLGYEYIDGEIIRIDSQLIHTEAVKPALVFLNQSIFDGPREEFLSAFDHFQHKNYKEALNDALKSFESMMKVICKTKGWTFDEKKDTAQRLIGICITNGLFPSYYQTHLGSLRSMLESGVPTIRNKEGGHGQGSEIKNIDPAIVSYTLHMTASAIVMLGELHKNL